jgi:lysylphosphatidylglycerol synthetase-like protein (DUF2156 family)
MNAAEFINHPSGFLADAPGNCRFELSGVTGLISYREKGRHWIAYAGVHAPTDRQAELLKAFLAAAHAASRRCLFVQVPQHQVALFEAHGATVNRLGSTFAVRLPGYSLKGTAKMQLRNKIQRARRAGLTAVELGRDSEFSSARRDELLAISRDWLRDKGKKELAFMVGVLGDERDRERRSFAALDGSGRMVAFITYVPAWGDDAGYLHDLSRRVPDAPPGAMELINAFAIERMRQEGVPCLHFGFTPFVASGEEPSSASPLMARIASLLYRHGDFIYPARSQADYKRKWGTDLVMPEFIAGFPLSLGGVFALLRVTRAL